MPRKPRIEYEGAAYHLMSRGNAGEAIFGDDEDRREFLLCLEQVCERTGWEIHAYVLLDNHYHLLTVTPEANLVAGMKWLQGTYTQRYNRRHRLRGHLLQGRYKALLVEPEAEGYFLTVSSYIHLNPARAGLIAPGEQRLSHYPWSSYPSYLTRTAPDWLHCTRVLGQLGWENTRGGRRRYGSYMRGRVLELTTKAGSKELDEEWKRLRRGWYFGGAEFRDDLLQRLDTVLSSAKRHSYSGGAVHDHGLRAAERIVEEGLAGLGLSEQDLQSLRKLDIRKQVLASVVRQRTVMGNEWVSKRLRMGHPSNVSRCLRTLRVPRERATRRLLKQLDAALISISKD